MSPVLPQFSGKEIIAGLEKIGYRVVRQRGSHIRIAKDTSLGMHKITIPYHDPIAKGTLNDILKEIGMWNNLTKEQLLTIIAGK